jgi:hypothetical protein
MPTKISIGQQAKYRIKKTIRDADAIGGTDYTPEFINDDGSWTELSSPCYDEEDAIEILRRRKKKDDVKVEYIYPSL